MLTISKPLSAGQAQSYHAMELGYGNDSVQNGPFAENDCAGYRQS